MSMRVKDIITMMESMLLTVMVVIAMKHMAHTMGTTTVIMHTCTTITMQCTIMVKLPMLIHIHIRIRMMIVMPGIRMIMVRTVCAA